MSLETNLSDFATRAATEDKALRTLINGNALDLSSLHTTAKSNLVAALNEVSDAVGAASGIDDGTTSTTSTWSSSKINTELGTKPGINDTTASTTSVYSSSKTDSQISAAVSGLVNSAPGTLDTLKELADALGDDANFSTTVNTALGNRVRVDTAAQGLTSTQQGNARTNIAAAAASDLSALTTAVGNTEQDLVAVFEAGLV